jgi:hypothetical protein
MNFTPCAIIAYSSFSDAYSTIIYESNLSALKTKENGEVVCEVFSKIGNEKSSRGLINGININKKNNYLFYPYVIQSNTKINSNGCSGFKFVIVPVNNMDYVVEFLPDNKMNLIKLNKPINEINFATDINFTNKKNPKIFFSGELNNQIIAHEYSYLSVSDKFNDTPITKIGLTPLGGFSLNQKSSFCVKDYCNFFFMPMKITNDQLLIRSKSTKELNKEGYEYAGVTKIVPLAIGVVYISGILLDLLSGKSTGINSNNLPNSKLDVRKISVKFPPICFGYTNMPKQGDKLYKLKGGNFLGDYWAYKLNKYSQKINMLKNI